MHVLVENGRWYIHIMRELSATLYCDFMYMVGISGTLQVQFMIFFSVLFFSTSRLAFTIEVMQFFSLKWIRKVTHFVETYQEKIK